MPTGKWVDLFLSSIKVHSTHVEASSLVHIYGISLGDMCAVATWPSSLVFEKHYTMDMTASRGISMQVLSVVTTDSHFHRL